MEATSEITGESFGGGKRRSDVALFGIYEISKLLNVPARLEHTLSGVLRLLSSFLDMRHGLIALLNEDGVPELAVGSGWNEQSAKEYFERLPEKAVGRIVVTKMPLVVEFMREDPLFENWDFSAWGAGAEGEDWSFIGVPIKDRGTVVGTLTIDREHGGASQYTFDEDVRFLSMVANLLGQTVRLQRLIARDREWLMDERRRLEKTIEHAAPSADRTST
ncbi:MAG TPA: GAF domain-containing protein, partial [Fibrobacteria bacterium]|nr:GAF domain-containing protein [Fibrobacteria bacterium]